MSIKRRLTLSVSLMILTVSLVLICVGKAGRIRVEKSLAAPVNVGKRYAWNMTLEDYADRMKKAGSNLEMAYGIRSALKKSDTEELKKNAGMFYDLMKDRNVFSHFRITDKNGKIVYSAPESYTEKTELKIVEKAAESLKYACELGQDCAGRIVLGLAVPIKSRKKLYGVGIFSVDMATISKAVAERDKSEIFVVNARGNLIGGSDPLLFSRIRPKLPETGEEDLNSVRIGDDAYSIAIQPIRSDDPEPLAHLVSIKKNTDAYMQNMKADIYLILLMSISVAAGILGLSIYIRSSLKPLETAIGNISAVANGDFTRKFDSGRNDEIGELFKALNKMKLDLGHMFEDLYICGQDLMKGAASQASAVEEVSSALGQVTDMTGRNAENAVNGKKSIAAIRETMQNVGSKVAELKKSMDEISVDSRQIYGIIAMIDEIAFKTNLLALNAAVEAARAGEAGAGFAVVADEVKTLAGKAGKSANDISNLIRIRVEKIETNAAIARETESAFLEILDAVSLILAAMDEIASGSGEQSIRITEINETMSEINKVVQNNITHSGKLHNHLDKFRLPKK